MQLIILSHFITVPSAATVLLDEPYYDASWSKNISEIRLRLFYFMPGFILFYSILWRDLFSTFYDDELGKNHKDNYMGYVCVSLNRGWTNFTFMWPCIVTNFFVINPTLCTNFIVYFVMKHYIFRTVRLFVIRSLFTVHSAMAYVIQVCRELSSRTRMVLLERCLQTCMTYTIAECTVNELLMMDRGTVRNM